ncbi:MAG: 4Fe-4S binding protein [Victivallales bacterium]|jgi:ferredoxin-type protein NapH|nr:4Fe-4S binding protein [Victivallales bacterium]MBT7161984.1 4Fe-4S binding protein [Victivallales bacterium]MBT7299096.1 4Fe-4S binding protein [Victivallales bacterium]
MRFDVPLFKISQRAILPIEKFWIDAAPFVIFFCILIAAHVLLHRGKRVQLWRRVSQTVSAFVFIIFLHRCLCMLRGWIFALNKVGRNDIVAFGHLCMFVLLVSLTLSFGRLFCGWLCPLGFFSEILSLPSRRRSRLPTGRRLLSGYLMLGGVTILVAWLGWLVRPGTQFFSENVSALWGAFLLLFLGLVLPFERKDRFFKKFKYVSVILWLGLSVIGVFVTSPWCTFFGDEIDYSSAVSLAAVLAGALVVPMAWCRYMCPMGGALGWLTRFSTIRVRMTGECTNCGGCDSTCPMGALDRGDVDGSSCIYCGQCNQVCDYRFVTETSKDKGDEA